MITQDISKECKQEDVTNSLQHSILEIEEEEGDILMVDDEAVSQEKSCSHIKKHSVRKGHVQHGGRRSRSGKEQIGLTKSVDLVLLPRPPSTSHLLHILL